MDDVDPIGLLHCGTPKTCQADDMGMINLTHDGGLLQQSHSITDGEFSRKKTKYDGQLGEQVSRRIGRRGGDS